MTLMDPNVSPYHLNGMRLATRSVKRLFVVLAFACMVPEAVQLFLLQDDRFLRVGAEARSRMCDKMAYLEDVLGYVWQRSARLVDVTEDPDALRSDSVHGGIYCMWLHVA